MKCSRCPCALVSAARRRVRLEHPRRLAARRARARAGLHRSERAARDYERALRLGKEEKPC